MKLNFEPKNRNDGDVVLINGLRFNGAIAKKIQDIASKNRVSHNKVIRQIVEQTAPTIEV